MSNYRNQDDMRQKGWTVEHKTTRHNCGAEIQWATSPSGKKLALDANSTEAHYKSCSDNGINTGESAQLRSAKGTVTPDLGTQLHSLELAVLENAGVTQELTTAVRALVERMKK